MYKEIIVVEGKNDASKLKSIFPEIECFITNGSAVLEHIEELVELSKTRELILFLDPDYPGERIRNLITQRIDCKQAFIKKSNAISKNNKKVGVEHASKEDIIEALENALTVDTNSLNKNLITFRYFNICSYQIKQLSDDSAKSCEQFFHIFNGLLCKCCDLKG